MHFLPLVVHYLVVLLSEQFRDNEHSRRPRVGVTNRTERRVIEIRSARHSLRYRVDQTDQSRDASNTGPAGRAI